MDTVSDSDGENSLPFLSAETIDVISLRRVFRFLSSETKSRLRTEAEGTGFESLYDQLCQDLPSSPEQIVVPTSSPQKDLSLMEIPQNELPSEAQASGLIPPVALSPGIQSESTNSGTFAGQRSLRKRTFASRHPYIADQADYLGICTVDSINEMFSDHDDLASVARVLNQLYLKRKKRYPDEERYKARNFYAHLGKSKAMALAGDPDAETLDSQNDLLSSQPDYVPEDRSEDEDQDLIPFDVAEQHKAPPRVYDSASGSEVDDDSDDDHERTSRGSLSPTSEALHFRPRVYKSRKQKKRVERPRKGLAVRKMTSHRFSKPSDISLHHFPETSTASEPLPPQISYFQPKITSFSSDLSEVLPSLSSSDYESDAESDIFSDSNIADTTKSSDNFEPHQSQLDSFMFSGAAQETDHINHLFASSNRSHKRKKFRSNNSAPKRPKSMTYNSTTIHHDNHRIANPKSSRTSFGGTRHHTSRPKDTSRQATSYTRPLTSSGRFNKNQSSKISSRNNGTTSGTTARSLQKQSILTVSVDSDSDKENTPSKRRPTSRSSRERHFLATTAFEVESLTKFVRNQSHGVAGTPLLFNPSKSFSLSGNLQASSDSILAFPNIHRIHTIGDGFIFCPHQDTVSFTLIGKEYCFGLFRQTASAKQLDKLFIHFRKLMTSPRAQGDLSIRHEMKIAVRGLINWLLILRSPIEGETWNLLRDLLDDFTKLQTKELRKQQTAFYSQFLLVYYIAFQLEKSVRDDNTSKLFKNFENFCSDFWSIIFRTYDSVDFSNAFIEDKPTELTESLCIMYFIFGSRANIWWPTVIDALDELDPLLDSCFEVMNATYALASICPSNKYDWTPFITILNSFQSSIHSDAHHDFIDVCELLHKNLNWPLEEKLVLTLYSSFAGRKFVNFDEENSVPLSISTISSRHDIPKDTVFGRFLDFVFVFISELSDRKEVKRLITKLVASSQYHYQKGRKFQIMFINRLNLILLLFQISDVDLSGPLSTLIDQIIEFKDMFIYSRAVDALNTFFEVSVRKNIRVPIHAFKSLLTSFSASNDKLHGMPSLLSKLIDSGLRLIDSSNITQSLDMLKAIDLNIIPDSSRERVLQRSISFAEVLRTLPTQPHSTCEAIHSIIRSSIAFLSSQMNRLPVSDLRRDEAIASLIEKAIQLWIHLAYATDTQNWNFMMLQKFTYLGNELSRQRFALYFCWVFLNQGAVTHSVIFEMDKIMSRALVSSFQSRYRILLYRCLSRRSDSLMFTRNPYSQSWVSIQAHKFSILSSVFSRIASTHAMANSEKLVILNEIVKELESEYNSHYFDQNTTDFLRRIVSSMINSCLHLLAEVEDFWSISEKLGFPSKRMQSMWAQSSNDERLSMLNNEFINALKFGKDYVDTLDKWIKPSNCRLLFALLEVYVVAVTKHDIYWAHILHILQYIHLRLKCCMIDVVDRSFMKLLQFVPSVASVASIDRDSNYAIFQIDSLTTCIEIMMMGFYIYDGYEEQQNHLDSMKDFELFLSAPKTEIESRSFTDITLNQLKGGDAGPFVPDYRHDNETYLNALKTLQAHLARARDVREHSSNPDVELETVSTSALQEFSESIDITF